MELMFMNQAYEIDRLYIISRRWHKRKFYSMRNRYLAKSEIINCKAEKQMFTYLNFRGSHFARVKFLDTEFKGCDFWGTHFNKCTFRKTHFIDCVFVGCKFSDCRFEDTSTEYTTIVNTNLSGWDDIKRSNHINILYQYPAFQHSDELDKALELFKDNRIFRKYKLLYLPGNRYNCLNIYLLQKKFSVNKLPVLLQALSEKLTKSRDLKITTYKRLEQALKNLQKAL